MRNLIEKYSLFLDNFFEYTKNEEFMRKIEKSVELMEKKNEVMTTGIGKSRFVAEKMSSTLRSLGIKSFFIHPSEASHGDLGGLPETDNLLIAFSKSGESLELRDIIMFCKNNGIPIISVTADENNFLANNSDVNINFKIKEEVCLENLAPTVSVVISLIIADIMCVELSRRRNFSKETFKRFHPGGKLGIYLLKVKDVQRDLSNTPLVTQDKKILDCLLTIAQYGCGMAIVHDDKKLLGVLTDGDIRRNIEKTGNDFLNEKIGNVMTKKPKTLNEEMFVKDAIDYMIDNNVNTCPVIDSDGNLKGIIHIRDIYSKLFR